MPAPGGNQGVQQHWVAIGQILTKLSLVFLQLANLEVSHPIRGDSGRRPSRSPARVNSRSSSRKGDLLRSLNHGRSKAWMANGSDFAKIIPAGMKVDEISLRDTSYLCCVDGGNDNFKKNENRCTEHLNKFVTLIDTDISNKDKVRLKTLSLKVKHRSETGDHAHIKQRPYRVSPKERSIIHTEVDNMLKLVIIQLSDSPWSSPVVLVKKKDGTWEFCVDYRRLSKITRKDVYPLPRIDNTLDSLRGASIFSTKGLKSEYWQIEEDDETDREKTAFVNPDGLFELKVMSLGLCNAPATFERIMDNLLRGLKWNICLHYLDDIIVFSNTMDEHLQRLEMVLSCFAKLQSALTSEPVLGHFDETAPIYVHTDASGYGVGAVLVQLKGGGVEQKDWDQVLPYVTFAYNTAKQEATGYTPFFLVHAREAETYIDAVLPYLPDEISDDYVGELSRSRLLQSQAKDRRLYDQKHTPVYYQKDDLVWVFTPIPKVGLSENLLKSYFGPYKVTKKLSEVTYEVEPVDPSPRSRKAKNIVHVIRMKPYLDPEEQHSILLGNTGRDRFPSRTRAETS
ncbi:K02A2.6-like [Cordylochernes scorpioides]|uniref:K02A2.6-like n=1 Tax=Cordylochernes scorpioides TaxID=51811 RepID=A0ABY6KEH0_9ARAC|nr:K02A2.6-like [Cordylochernes scorpioides]